MGHGQGWSPLLAVFHPGKNCQVLRPHKNVAVKNARSWKPGYGTSFWGNSPALHPFDKGLFGRHHDSGSIGYLLHNLLRKLPGSLLFQRSDKTRVVPGKACTHKLLEQQYSGSSSGTPGEILKDKVPAVRQHQQGCIRDHCLHLQ